MACAFCKFPYKPTLRQDRSIVCNTLLRNRYNGTSKTDAWDQLRKPNKLLHLGSSICGQQVFHLVVFNFRVGNVKNVKKSFTGYIHLQCVTDAAVAASPKLYEYLICLKKVKIEWTPHGFQIRIFGMLNVIPLFCSVNWRLYQSFSSLRSSVT